MEAILFLVSMAWLLGMYKFIQWVKKEASEKKPNIVTIAVSEAEILKATKTVNHETWPADIGSNWLGSCFRLEKIITRPGREEHEWILDLTFVPMNEVILMNPSAKKDDTNTNLAKTPASEPKQTEEVDELELAYWAERVCCPICGREFNDAKKVGNVCPVCGEESSKEELIARDEDYAWVI